MNDAERSHLTEVALECLQSAFTADPSAIHTMIVNRVPCNRALADHPYIVVDETPVLERGHFTVGLVGVVAGLMTAMGLTPIAYKFDEDNKDGEGRPRFVGFTIYNPKGNPNGTPLPAE